MSCRLWVMGLLSVACVGILWFTEVPLGVPGEWTWNRIAIGDDGLDVLLGLAQAVIVGSVYGLIAWGGLRRIGSAPRWELTAWFAALCVTATAWLFTVQESPPEGHRLSKAPWVLYYPGMTGYFYTARYTIDDTARFLREYDELMAQGDVLHVGTHPPGMFLLYRGLISLMDAMPSLIPLLSSTQPDSVIRAEEIIAQGPLSGDDPFLAQDRAVLWLATLLSHAAVVFAVVPLFAVLRLSRSRESAWKAVCFWPCLPAIAVFLPKCDVLFSGWAVVFWWSWLSAVERRSCLAGFVAGTIGWIGLSFSLVFLPIGFAALLATVIWAASSRKDAPVGIRTRLLHVCRQSWQPVLGGAVAVVALTAASALIADLNLVTVWSWNYHNHARFYEKYVRTMWLWLLVNPLELAVAMGAPFAVLAVQGMWRAWRAWRNRSISDWDGAAALAVSAVWVLLWLSGKNSGEAARLWIPLMPLAAVFVVENSQTALEPDMERNTNREWCIALCLQMAVCALTVARVSGFHYG